MERGSLPSSGPKRAMVIDDSRAMRAMLRHVLEGDGYEVSEAVDGRAALTQLASGVIPELALIDWNMPGLDGLTLIRALRSSAKFDRMTIVMVTSEADPAHVETALVAGADEYIMKPLSPEVLREKLNRLSKVASP